MEGENKAERRKFVEEITRRVLSRIAVIRGIEEKKRANGEVSVNNGVGRGGRKKENIRVEKEIRKRWEVGVDEDLTKKREG